MRRIWTPYIQMPHVAHDKEQTSILQRLQQLRTRRAHETLQALPNDENKILQKLRRLWTLAAIHMSALPVRSNFDRLFSTFFRSFL
jgi:hypothetical protein